MLKKFLLFSVIAAVMVIEMPFAASAATGTSDLSLSTSVNKPQIRIRIGQGRRHRRYPVYRRQQARYRVVPQYYWSNGRRYVRYVRVRNF